jgi:carboxyl-terminal processing protease
MLNMRFQTRHLLVMVAVFLGVALASFGLGRLIGSGAHVGDPKNWIASLTGVRGLGNSPSRTFDAVLENLESSFVDRITDERPLSYGAVRQMVDALGDPNSRFLEPWEVADVLEAEDGTFHGIGAILNFEKADGLLKTVVANVLPGSPAEHAGLKPGDVIVRVNDQWVMQAPRRSVRVVPRGTAWKPGDGSGKLLPLPKDETELAEVILTSPGATMRLLSTDNATVTLALRTNDPLTLETVSMRTSPTTVKAVETSEPEDGAVTLRIGGFTRTIGPELDAAVAKAKAFGAKRLVLDLRGSVGGPLERSLQVAARFTDGPVGFVERKTAGKLARQPLTVTPSGERWSGPLAVLVDRTTLGTAELLAAALQSRNRATLVGARTFGDGTEQNIIPLKDGSAIQLTTGKYYTTDGIAYNARGVTPRRVVAEAGAQLTEALKALKGARG